MPATYGYVKRSEGADGDQVDVYVGEKPDAPTVWVVDQVDAESKAFDEHKAFLGFESTEEVVKTYDAAFDDGKGPQRRGAVVEMPFDAFREWVRTGATKKPLAANLGDVPGGAVDRTQEVQTGARETRVESTEQPAPSGESLQAALSGLSATPQGEAVLEALSDTSPTPQGSLVMEALAGRGPTPNGGELQGALAGLSGTPQGNAMLEALTGTEPTPAGSVLMRALEGEGPTPSPLTDAAARAEPTEQEVAEAAEVIDIRRKDGQPFKSQRSAMLAARGRKLTGQPTKIEGGWALRSTRRRTEPAAPTPPEPIPEKPGPSTEPPHFSRTDEAAAAPAAAPRRIGRPPEPIGAAGVQRRDRPDCRAVAGGGCARRPGGGKRGRLARAHSRAD